MTTTKASGASVPVLDYLRREAGAAELVPAARRLIELAAAVDRLLPRPIAAACEVAGYDDGVLRIRVASAGVAAKLRQTLPRLERGLVEAGWQVTSIRTKVRPNEPSSSVRGGVAPGGTPIPERGVAAFEALEQALDESPLRDAVQRLLAKRRP